MVRLNDAERLDRTARLAPRFADTLREMRERCYGRRGHRLTQSELAEMAGFDHSYVSRLETGTRLPTRDAALKLAAAMDLGVAQRDALLASAGFMPSDTSNLFASEPVIGELAELLGNRTIEASVRDDVRQMVTLLVRQAQRTRRNLQLAAD